MVETVSFELISLVIAVISIVGGLVGTYVRFVRNFDHMKSQVEKNKKDIRISDKDSIEKTLTSMRRDDLYARENDLIFQTQVRTALKIG